MRILAGMRVTAGLTQTDVANALGITQSAVSLWESGEGKPSLNKVPQLADLYGVASQDIIDACMSKPYSAIISGNEGDKND